VAVLIEGVSVVVRCDSIERKHSGGVKQFSTEVPNPTLCADGELARVGFMTPDDTKAYVEHLERRGLKYGVNGKAQDIVVVDQRTGMRAPCDWAAFGSANWNDEPGKPIAICAAVPSNVKTVIVPEGWVFERSLSASHRFIDANNIPASLKLIRRDPHVDVYLDEQDGREYYVGRSG
jgi:hypothetical protein